MIMFLDTEFTDLTNDMELLSLAMVSLDGAFEFYGERNDVPVKRCSRFVRQVVLGQMTALPPIAGNLENLGWRLRAFLDSLPQMALLACDSHYDLTLLKRLLVTMPGSLSPHWIDLTKWPAQAVFSEAQARYHADHPRHHALNDARGLRAGYQAWANGQPDPFDNIPRMVWS